MIIHLIPHPVSAKRFVEPLVQHLIGKGCEAELWVEQVAGLDNFYDGLICPKRTAIFNLSANPLRMLYGAIGLWCVMRARRPQVIQAHLMRGALIPLLVAWLLRVPIRIYHNHGVPFVGYQGLLRIFLRTIEWLNCKLSTHVLTVSEGMRQILVDEKLSLIEKCKVLGPGSACGIDLSNCLALEKGIDKRTYKLALGLAPEVFVVLYVGRPHRRKGFDSILAIWARAFHDQKAVLLLAGIHANAVSRVLGEIPFSIRPLGYLYDLNSYYAAADVVVLPSEHEGFGYSLLEGASYGCCLVASDIPGPDALIQDGQTGFLVRMGDHDAWSAVLLKLANEHELCRELGKNARINAEKFERTHILKLYSEYIESIVT